MHVSPAGDRFVFSEEAKLKLFLLPAAQTRIEPLRSLLPQIRRHFNTALLNIAALRPHLCVCHSCFKALGFPPLSLFSALGFKLRCLNGPRLINSFHSFACRQAEFPLTVSSAKRFVLFFMVGGDKKIPSGSLKAVLGLNVIDASGRTSSSSLHFSIDLDLLLLLSTSLFKPTSCFLPLQLDDCTLQLSHNGTYLDMESSLAEQRDELEGFQQDDTG